MHGTINRGLQFYVCDIFGVETWEDTCARAELANFNFETMLSYDDAITERLVDGLTRVLGRERDDILEDFGTFVVSDARMDAVRKLLRFGGDTFVEFLQSLEDIYDRAKIALPDLDMPQFELETHSDSSFTLHIDFEKLGYGAVFLGLLRVMADDYGALVLIEHTPQRINERDRDIYEISVLHLGWPDVTQDQAVVV